MSLLVDVKRMKEDKFVALFMPYCIQKQPSGKFVVLNRHYKPLGMERAVWVDYKPYEVVKCLSETYYLYDDATAPCKSKKNMVAYLEKFSCLSSRQVKSETRTLNAESGI